MSSQDEILNLPIHGTVIHIVQTNGLCMCPRVICEQFNLHTLEDIGNLTDQQIKSIVLETSLR
jgi:hypothetical protein